jgi:hypothetical protein
MWNLENLILPCRGIFCVLTDTAGNSTQSSILRCDLLSNPLQQVWITCDSSSTCGHALPQPPSALSRICAMYYCHVALTCSCTLQLARYVRGEMSALMYCRFFVELVSSNLGYTVVYTDGSSVHCAPCWALNSMPHIPLSIMRVSRSLHRLLKCFTQLHTWISGHYGDLAPSVHHQWGREVCCIWLSIWSCRPANTSHSC